MLPKPIPYREGNNIVIYDRALMAEALAWKPTTPISPKTESSKVRVKSSFVKDFVRGAGFMCIFLGIIGAFISIIPIAYAEIASNLSKETFSKPESMEPQKQVVSFPTLPKIVIPIADQDELNNNILNEQNKAKFIAKEGLPKDSKWDFSLLIPKIGLNTVVTPNVDPINKDEYLSVLKKGVAHAKFTSFPNEEGIVYIFGHSTDYPWNIKEYNALFYSIKDLKEGDKIIILYKNKPYVYKTLYQKIIDDDNLVYLNAKTNAKMLVLQTCYPPGTTWKRLVVVASLVEENNP